MRRRDARAPDVAGPAHDYGSRVMSRRRISDSKIEGRLLYGSTPLQNPAIVNVRRMEWNSTTGRRRCTQKISRLPEQETLSDGGWRICAAGGGCRQPVSVGSESWEGVGERGQAIRTMRTMQVSDDGRCSGQCNAGNGEGVEGTGSASRQNRDEEVNKVVV